ncbi:MAG: hypothetical protein DRI69_09520, partial [Bacteroidetes bacterium]
LLEKVLTTMSEARARYIRLDLGTAHSNIGEYLLNLERYDEAVPHFQHSLDADLNDLGKSGETVSSYQNFGRLYFAQGHIEEGLTYFSQAEEIVLNHYSEAPAQAVYFYNDLGREYFRIGDAAKAHQYYLKALSFHNENMSDAASAITYFNLAESAARLDSIDLAEEHYRMVLRRIQVDISDPVNISSGREEYALKTLMGIANLKTEPDSALHYLLPAHVILQKLLKEAALGDEAQLRFREIAYPLYEAIQLEFIRLGKPEQALQYCDITKSGLLRQRWIESEALVAADVPADLLDSKRSLQYERTQVLQSSGDEAKKNARAFSIQARIDSIDNKIFNAFPKFSEYINNSDLNPMMNAESSESIICFFTGIDSTLVYVLTGSDLELFVISTDTLTHAAEALNASVSQTPGISESGYKVNAALLSDLLFAPLNHAAAYRPERITIVPDGPLSFTPFELLHFDEGNEMLLTTFPMRYLTSLGGRNHQKSRLAKKRFAGFAPSYKAPDIQDTITDGSLAELVRSGYYDLPGAAAEVAAISILMDGESFVDSAATKSEFIGLAQQYQILHMSMHAIADIKQPGQSRLLFTANSDNRLTSEMTASEIRSLKFNADLVVLSACQTNVGKLYRGEGVMSLSRAFAFAGIPSSVTSLWKVPDASTAAIMEDFYKNLLNGENKDNALRLAKLNYLSNVKFEAQSHPRYWAGFVLTGDPASLRSNSGRRYWIFAGLGAMLLLFIFILKGGRSKRI